jgi:hypothetical protein
VPQRQGYSFESRSLAVADDLVDLLQTQTKGWIVNPGSGVVGFAVEVSKADAFHSAAVEAPFGL